MAIQSDKNLYPGINAHLNSFLRQPDGGWEMFHGRYINEIVSALDLTLPENYYVGIEKSLQLHAFDIISEIPIGKASRTTPDVTLYQTSAARRIESGAFSSVTPTLEFPIAETFEEEHDFMSALVYRIDEGKYPGIPVTRIEVLSPANKPPGTHYPQYLSKRQETLKSGLRLVEIDFLHETRPFLRQVPSYPDRDTNSYPYSIIISDPRPTVVEGQTQVYGFGVDASLPALEIPLADLDTVYLDFGAIYHRIYEGLRALRIVVDYEQTPVNFERYSSDDRERIRQHMATIKASL